MHKDVRISASQTQTEQSKCYDAQMLATYVNAQSGFARRKYVCFDGHVSKSTGCYLVDIGSVPGR